MDIRTTAITDVIVVTPKIFRDERGFFTESYSKRTFDAAGLVYDFVQDNHSLSVDTGVIRGLHYQMNPKAQTKIVRVTHGAIFDVAIDIRMGSPTYGKWVGETLTAEVGNQLIVPKGFAHGFCTLEANTEVMYKVDEFYSPEHDRNIRWDDPDLKIDWPVDKPILSEKDRNAPSFAAADNNFVYGEKK
jgi:dTDP-4-dehydrorhamnose 3,5-epimerase